MKNSFTNSEFLFQCKIWLIPSIIPNEMTIYSVLTDLDIQIQILFKRKKKSKTSKVFLYADSSKAQCNCINLSLKKQSAVIKSAIGLQTTIEKVKVEAIVASANRAERLWTNGLCVSLCVEAIELMCLSFAYFAIYPPPIFATSMIRIFGLSLSAINSCVRSSIL